MPVGLNFKPCCWKWRSVVRPAAIPGARGSWVVVLSAEAFRVAVLIDRSIRKRMKL